jgi:hypothetical protein
MLRSDCTAPPDGAEVADVAAPARTLSLCRPPYDVETTMSWSLSGLRQAYLPVSSQLQRRRQAVSPLSPSWLADAVCGPAPALKIADRRLHSAASQPFRPVCVRAVERQGQQLHAESRLLQQTAAARRRRLATTPCACTPSATQQQLSRLGGRASAVGTDSSSLIVLAVAGLPPQQRSGLELAGQVLFSHHRLRSTHERTEAVQKPKAKVLEAVLPAEADGPPRWRAGQSCIECHVYKRAQEAPEALPRSLRRREIAKPHREIH